jgi:hypothetical protein
MPSALIQEFPIIALVVTIVTMILTAIAAFTRWVWREVRAEQDRDRTWREQQNEKREAAQVEINNSWRQAMKERDDRWEKIDAEQRGILERIANGLKSVQDAIEQHDVKTEVALATMRGKLEATRSTRGKAQ